LLWSSLLLFGQAPPAEHNAMDLAKTTQNPVGDIVSVPFQFNFNSGGALKDETYFNLNFQPVIPIHISPKVTLISRTIFPIDSFPGANGTRYSGVGDVQEQMFFTSAKAGKVIWGIGPAFSFPIATAFPARTGTWAAGGAAVVLTSPGPWVIGSLFTQFSPLADSNGQPRTNLFLWQYFINYNFGKGWAIATAPSITANWDAPGRTAMDRAGRYWHQPHPRVQSAANDAGIPVLQERQEAGQFRRNSGALHFVADFPAKTARQVSLPHFRAPRLNRVG
jgi:hypothetical protein